MIVTHHSTWARTVTCLLIHRSRTARHLARVGRGTFHAAMPDGAWGDELAKLDKELTEVGREGGDGGSGGRRRLTN